MVLIGSARNNEFGGITGGAPGDQTGGEVSTQNWYLHNKGWVVIRPRDQAVAEKIAQCMEWACANDNIGYCQDHRLTCYNAAKSVQFDCRMIDSKVEVDCSELIRICVAYAGILVGDFNTAKEVTTLAATGVFEILRDGQHCNSSDYLKRGDILVTSSKGHTVVVLSNGAQVIAEQKAIGWYQDAIGWWYVYNTAGNYYKSGWQIIDHHWYLFGDDGYMLTGWQQWKGQWYYLNTEKGPGEGQCWHEAPGGNGALEAWYIA